MIKKQEDPEDLYYLTEDEKRHLELCFLKEFTDLLNKYKEFYKSHHVYKMLSDIHEYSNKQLEWEESRVA